MQLKNLECYWPLSKVQIRYDYAKQRSSYVYQGIDRRIHILYAYANVHFCIEYEILTYNL